MGGLAWRSPAGCRGVFPAPSLNPAPRQEGGQRRAQIQSNHTKRVGLTPAAAERNHATTGVSEGSSRGRVTGATKEGVSNYHLSTGHWVALTEVVWCDLWFDRGRDIWHQLQLRCWHSSGNFGMPDRFRVVSLLHAG